MSKWRPSPECIYVIPDIHGQIKLLKKICDRILPLRTTGGVKDIIVFLGDYVDRGSFSAEVIEFIIDLKKTYKDQIVTIKGNHEDLLMNACGINEGILNPSDAESSYGMWISNGGIQTILSYLKLRGLKTNPYLIRPYRIKQILPEEHIKFFRDDLIEYFELDDFIFVHGGCNPYEPLITQSEKALMWDRTLCRTVINRIKNGISIDWNKTIVTGHNGATMKGIPLIHEKFMMIDLCDDKRLLVVELNSCEAFVAKRGANRLVKFELEETCFN